MSEPLRVLVAGAAGALGQHVTRELVDRGHHVRALTRTSRLPEDLLPRVEVVTADARDLASLDGACDGRDALFSCLGASVIPEMARGRRSFRAVDTPANLNLLTAAGAAAVRRFVYVSVAGHEELSHLAYVAAHEAVVRALRRSPLSGCVIRPPGFFAAFLEVVRMAERGAVPVIGDGSALTNPIDERDLAAVCADAVEGEIGEVSAGGPEVLTRKRIVELAFAVLGKDVRTRSLPPAVLRAMAPLIRPLNARVADLTAFYTAVSTRDLVVPRVGRRTLADYFAEVASAST